MKHNAVEWRELRREFVEAAAKYDEYETFIVQQEIKEDWYCNNGRYFSVGLIRWPRGKERKCWILAPDSGSDVEPFFTMKTLFNEAWLWLPREVVDDVVEAAEMHLSNPPSPPVGTELFWASSDYQYWCWLLWFHWLRQYRAANPSDATKPPQKITLAPFHRSADLIAQWGLDGGEGTFPQWLAPKLPQLADKGLPKADSKEAKDQTWQEVKAVLERMLLQGDPYTSEQKLADKIGCSKFLVNKAFKNGSAELLEWRNKPHVESRRNVSPEASALAIERTAQSREDDPAEFIEPEVADDILEYLINQAGESQRQHLTRLRPDQRQAMAKIVLNDPDKEEQFLRYREAKRSRRD